MNFNYFNGLRLTLAGLTLITSIISNAAIPAYFSNEDYTYVKNSKVKNCGWICNTTSEFDNTSAVAFNIYVDASTGLEMISLTLKDKHNNSILLTPTRLDTGIVYLGNGHEYRITLIDAKTINLAHVYNNGGPRKTVTKTFGHN